MKITYNKNIIITTTVLIVMVAAAVYFGIWPLIKKSVSLYQNSKNSNAQITKLEQEIDNLSKLDVTLKNNESKIDKTLSYLPKEEKTNFITQVEALAGSTNNNIKSIDLEKEKSTFVSVPNTKEQIFTITINGNFVSIQNFLSGLEKLNQYNNIYYISINAEEDSAVFVLTGATYTRSN